MFRPIAENCRNLKISAIGRNMYFSIANKHHHLAIFIVVFLTKFTSPYDYSVYAA